MSPSHRPTHRRRGPVTAVTGGVFRLILLGIVLGLGAVLFALALLPPVGAAGRMVQRFSDQFNRIGADVDLTFPRLAERSTIYAADGSVLATLFLDENRKVVRLHRVNPVAIDAVLAIEDGRFYEHRGVDLAGILRALITNVGAGDVEQGASTITQQLARNVFEDVGTERTLARKVHEARVAIRMEEEYTKDEILEIYLNEVYFGRGVYGIGAASELYFGKNPAGLELHEAAMLAGLVASPERFSPLNDKEAARNRRNVVIERMGELGMITASQAEEAKAKKLGLNITRIGNEDARYPFFVEYLKRRILTDERFGRTQKGRVRTLFQGGLKIYTTLDPGLQDAGERIAGQHLSAGSGPATATAAVDTETGAIRAIIGGSDFKASQVNLATGQGGSGRQAGSAFKPFTLAAAFEEGIPVGKMYRAASGQQVNCGEHGGRYRVVNAGDGGGSGFVNLATATAGSINAVFVQLAIDVGPPKIVDVAHRMGIQSHLDPYCTITLGVEEVTPLEMASAFTTLANEGVHCRPFAITRITARGGGEILKQKRGRCEEAIDPDVADKVAGLLRLVVQEGTGTAANLGRWPVFGKTGTTNDSADVWFSGCTRQICAATWVGHPEGRIPMPGAYGGTVAAPIWHDFMMVAMRGLPPRSLPPVPRLGKARVPDVVGMDRGEASRVLKRAGFTPQIEVARGSGEEGTVMSQTPSGGTRTTAGSLVTLRVSDGSGPGRSTVPDVVGLRESEARAALREAGYGVEVAYLTTPAKPRNGRVAGQAPGPRARLEPGSTVRIDVYRYEKPKGNA